MALMAHTLHNRGICDNAFEKAMTVAIQCIPVRRTWFPDSHYVLDSTIDVMFRVFFFF